MADMLIISKKYHNPEIKYIVELDGLELQIQLDDYIKAVLLEIEKPKWFTSPVKMEQNLRTAFANVLQHIKDQSVNHLPPRVE